MLEIILSETLLVKISLLIIVIVLFDYFNKFIYSMNLSILGFLGILLFLSLTLSKDNYFLFALLSLVLGFCFSLFSYYLSFPKKTIINISISLLIILLTFKLIPLFLPEYNLGIDTRELVNSNTIYRNKFLPLFFLISSLCFALLYYYDTNGPLKIGLQLLSSDINANKYIPVNKTYLIILFSFRITLGVVLYSFISIHKGIITIDEFGFDYLFEIIAYLLLISSFNNFFKKRYNNIFYFFFLFFIIPAFFVYVFEMIQRFEAFNMLSQNLIYIFIWTLILCLSVLSTIRNNRKENV